MAGLYLDQNVALGTRRQLEARGHQVTIARDERLDLATDDVHLFHASRNDWTLVTHNREDYELLQSAWRRWSVQCHEWRSHAGILVVPQNPIWPADEAAAAIHQFLQRDLSLTDELYAARGRSGNPTWYRWTLDAHRGRWNPC